jgi:serine protease Do
MLMMLSAALAAPVDIPQPDTYDPRVSLAPLIEAVSPAVVAIEVEGKRSGEAIPPELRQFFELPDAPNLMKGEGSGFVISKDGLVLTNFHVVHHADAISARMSDGRMVNATYVGGDAALDVALLRLEGAGDWPYLKLGNSTDTKMGDWVIAMGNPLGLGLTATTGIVSGKGRVLHHDRRFGSDDFLQTDAAINQGNSGGPLMDLAGNVLGMNTAILAGANTVGFAIPIDKVEEVLDDLESRGHVARGFIGVEPQRVTDSIAELLNLDRTDGALVARVVDGMPASNGGVKRGDLIVAVNGIDVDTPQELVRQVASHRPGETVKLSVVREGRDKELSVTLAERPEE